MDHGEQQKSRRWEDKRSISPPHHEGPRRLAFRIRRRRFTFEGCPSLLINDRYGVWSVSHRRYIQKTRRLRFHDLKREPDPIRILVRKLGMSRWPQYSRDEELRSLRRKLAGFYWGVMPEEEKERTVRLFRDRRERRRAKELPRFAAAVVCLAVVVFVLLRLVLMGCYSVPASLFLGWGCIVSAFLLDMAWHS